MQVNNLDIIRLCDTETTGLPPNAEMVEIGWTDLCLYPDGWQIVDDQRSAFVNPGRPIPANVTAIHGITDDMVKDGMTPADARTLLARGATIHAAHNARFDKQFIRSGLPWICTLECARKVWPSAPNHKNETLRTYLGIDIDGDAHRAGYDAAVSARILLQLFKHMSIEEMISVSDPGHVPLVMPFGKHKGDRFKDIPDYYLRWIVNSDDMAKGIKTAARNEITYRESQVQSKAQAPAPRRNPDWDRGF